MQKYCIYANWVTPPTSLAVTASPYPRNSFSVVLPYNGTKLVWKDTGYAPVTPQFSGLIILPYGLYFCMTCTQAVPLPSMVFGGTDLSIAVWLSLTSVQNGVRGIR